jgi:hypothetical protein
VKTRVEVYPFTVAAGTLGANPAFAVAGTAARTRNQVVVTELGAAASMLQAELARCLGSSDASCSAINANRQAATELVTSATATANGIAFVYGTPTSTGAPYAPVDRGLLHNAIDARLANLNNQFIALLGEPTSGDWIAARPVAAAPLAYADFQRILSDTSIGIAARPFTDVEYSHVGDVEVGAKILLVDTYGHRIGSVPTRGSGIRLAVAGLLRLPTAQLAKPDDFIGIGTGDRQTDVEVRGFLDLVLHQRLWTSAVLRYGMQRPDRLVMRITDSPGDPFPSLLREHEVARDLGDFMELEVAPRYVPNDALGFSLDYRFRSKGADTYSGFSLPADGIDASTLGLGTEQEEHRVGAAITYSTVRGYNERQSRWPVEVSLMHTRVISGRGVPRYNATGVAVRLYRRMSGPNSLRPAR